MADPVPAPPPLTDREAALILLEIRRLYALTERLPYKSRSTTTHRLGPSAAYTALEIQIRGLTDRYRAWEARHPIEKCRMAKATLRPQTDHDDDDRHPRRRQDR
jgi:hypothetical protein